MTFVKGQSGNPAGRPPGALNKKTLLLEAMLAADSPDLVQKLIEKAMAGDNKALRLCLDRLLPRGRDRPVPFTIRPIESGDDVRAASGDISQALFSGELTPREADALLGVVIKLAGMLARDEARRAAIAN